MVNELSPVSFAVFDTNFIASSTTIALVSKSNLFITRSLATDNA